MSVEVDGGGGSNGPYTVFCGTPGSNVIYDGDGILGFNGPNWRSSNAAGSVSFHGTILGDSALGGPNGSGWTTTGPALVQALASGTPAKMDFSGTGNGSYYSGFNLGDGAYPLDAAGHYWGIQHDSSHAFLIFSYNGAGGYSNNLHLFENGGIFGARNTLDDGTGNASLAGGLAVKLRTITASATLTGTDSTVLLNAATLTATLPTAVGITGRTYTVKLITASTGTVATTSSQTIDGATTYSLSANHKYVTVQSDGANWQIVANN